MVNKTKMWSLILSPFVSYGLTLAHIKKIAKFFKNPEQFLKSSPSKISSLNIMPPSVIKNITENKIITTLNFLNKLKKLDIGFIDYNEDSYPKILKEIDNPPAGLFYRGNPEVLKNISIAVVGTRKPTSYGIEATKYFVRQLILHNFTITSGLAIGIDSIAQTEAIKNNGATIGVVGCGLDIIYPKANHKLTEDIVKNKKGVLISEFPPETPPLPHHFPMRNRIISGLTVGTIVVEGSIRSGSLITGNSALMQNREVFAVPGSIFSSKSKAPHSLIKQGAKLIESIEDILEELPAKPKISAPTTKTNKDNLSPAELTIYNLIEQNGEMSINEIIKLSKIDAQSVLKILTSLELKNLIKDIGHKQYLTTK